MNLTATAARANRQGYYGLGNDTRYFPDSIGPTRPYMYQVSRTTLSGRLTIQRRIAGGLRAVVGASYARTDFRALPGESQFSRDTANGTLNAADLPFADLAVRLGAVLDVRDHEIDPHQGVFAEVLYTAGNHYERFTGIGRVYVQPLERFFLAARLVGEEVQGPASLSIQTSVETSERPIDGLGGYRSLRGYYDMRFAGTGKLIAGVEARYALLWAPSIVEAKLVAFYEAGRVFAPGEAWRLTTDGLHPSSGLELAVRLQRNTVIVTGFAVGDDGWRFLWSSGWSF